MGVQLGHRRGIYVDAADELRSAGDPLAPGQAVELEWLDLVYRSLCAILFNYVPTSGHPGGSISSGRLVQGLVFDSLDQDLSRPDREDQDVLSYAAGHKALGLYALWALRDEIARLGAPDLLPTSDRKRLRMEDLLGFRRNPAARSPLSVQLGAKALDGHPTPATPFVRLATGASGVGVASSIGLAIGLRDRYGAGAPRVHIVEGEGGLTPGRVAEALAAAATASLDNVVLHVDWNQASIDTERVCRAGRTPGDYVQWNPIELALLHDWNVIHVAAGLDFQQILAAQRLARRLDNGQPTAVVYNTLKGWRYGILGRASHGAGHPLCSDGFRAALAPLLNGELSRLPCCEDLGARRCGGTDEAAVMEGCFWEALEILRGKVAERGSMVAHLAGCLIASRERLEKRHRKPRPRGPRIESVFEVAERDGGQIPAPLRVEPGSTTTLRGELGKALQHLNRESGGALFITAADLLGSTSVGLAGQGFPEGYYNARSNPEARLLAVGGICEDAMAGVCAGLSSGGHHIGVASSYAAFLAPLGHIAARLHAIGAQARRAASGGPYPPMILVCAHAGLKTGEDGPTHADPQALQLLQENFPPGTAVTLTPWEPQEIWPLLAAALARRPAVIAPFVTRPTETVPHRARLGLAPVEGCHAGVYLLRRPRGEAEITLVLQESAVTLAFVNEVLPRLDREGIDVEAYYVASAELFDALPEEDRARIFPEERAREAMGITGFTLPTMYRWIRSDRGRAATLHPYRQGHYLGSGQGPAVLAEAGLDGEGQYRAIFAYLDSLARSR